VNLEQKNPQQQIKTLVDNDEAKKINLNNALLNDLVKIKGVGPKTAAKIIEYRDLNGLFNSIDEIQKIKGIGPKKFEAMKDKISVND